MVRCTTCSFRCHLYCFSPPLKQHPAFLIRQQQQNPQKESNNTPPIWKCDKCKGTSVVFNANAATTKLLALSSGEKNTTKSELVQPVQPQWIENSEVVFDWYRFRTEKTELLRCRDIDPNHTRNGVDELVFYSKTYALMKKTSAIWRAHVLRRRQFRKNKEFGNKAIQYPHVRFNVMHERKPTDKNSYIHEEDLDDEDVNLVETSHYVRYSRRRPRLPLLWKGVAPSALMCWTTGERIEIADVLAEIEERVCIANEDINVPSPMTETFVNSSTEADEFAILSAGPNDKSFKTVDIHTAATIIQTFARHRYQHRRISRANRRRRALEEAQRRAKAHSSMTLLRTCIQFIVILMKMLGQARTKKAMLLVLQDAAEEARVKNDIIMKGANNRNTAKPLDGERMKQLAGVRIRRFFVRRVHPYLKLKKIVMARRIQRWWMRSLYLYKWREAAIVFRHAHRDQACTRIQRFYRQSRVRSRFRESIERHAFNKLRRVLTRWWFSHLAKKEEKRRAAFEAAQQNTSVDRALPENAPLDEIVEKRGMDLYHDSDFWNAASLLERLYEMRKGNLTRELLQALAYSHHMVWYTSYDQFNLSRAHELYCSILKKGWHGTQVDPSVLHDLAIVLMHMEHFGDSLRLLAKLIEYFARQPQFPLWLLLAAVQLQHQGEWEQSVEYLTYLHDIPPHPYLERDILALAAMGYEHLAFAAVKTSDTRTSNAVLANEAWRAALRQMNLEKITDVRPDSASIRGNGRALTSRQKWELLTNLGQRALEQGHYLLACRVYIYALERVDKDEEKQSAWWNLADAFRHLGRLDLYLDAALRSHPNSSSDETQQKYWRERADQQAHSFQTELKTLTVLEKLRQLSGSTK
ncbi:Hypothetical protein PHPALM_7726 [Phytophthora palmivora]|uniref:Uncharacterized protein n=1 Tax=Phytophthora palmivora TaxID=4796 RepID=A0A2P4YBL1_9STRA|nr:Hypothetical protein PHPALM_7726 [Phytophthora palmivora]